MHNVVDSANLGSRGRAWYAFRMWEEFPDPIKHPPEVDEHLKFLARKIDELALLSRGLEARLEKEERLRRQGRQPSEIGAASADNDPEKLKKRIIRTNKLLEEYRVAYKARKALDPNWRSYITYPKPEK